MPPQQLITKRSPPVLVVGRLIDAHSRLTRELSAQLVAAHRLTLSEYEVLMLLARAPDLAMRRVDLAHQACLSPSGVTRMLDRLEGAGLVAKRECREDARVTYAALTEAGLAKLERCAPDHVAAIERLLGERFDGQEVDSLVELLGRLSAPADQAAPGG